MDVHSLEVDILNFLDDREPMHTKRKSSYKVNSLIHPWNSVMIALYKLFTLEGHYLEFGGYHFILISHFRGKLWVYLPYFLFHSLESYIRRNRGNIPTHQGLIKNLN